MYNNVKIHHLMLKDNLRTIAYRDAISELVKTSFSVIDFGCGSGILSFFAEDAGADEVYAIDRSKFIKVAHKLAKENQYKKIRFFHGEHYDFHLSKQVDVIVSEWMGSFVFHECMFEPLLELRNKHLKKNGLMIPSDLSLFAGLVTDQSIYDNLAYFQHSPYDVNFSVLNELMFSQTYVKHLKPNQVSNQTIHLHDIDMLTIKQIPVLTNKITIEKSMTVYAICGWFDAQLTNSIEIKTGPFNSKTHWRQLMFPLSSPLKLSAGEQLEIKLQPIHSTNSEIGSWRWIVKSDSQFYDMNDILWNTWMMTGLEKGLLL